MMTGMQNNCISPGKKSVPQPISAAGIGLRSPHIHQILSEQPAIAWLELLADNHIAEGGLIPAQLRAICDLYPITLHSVGLSLGSTEPVNPGYLKKLKQLKSNYHINWLSDHLCFSSHGGMQSHDLLPTPFNEENIKIFVDNISRVQDIWGERILVENISSYINFKASDMSEIEFISEIAQRADCDLLIDINNLYVNHINHGTDTRAFIDALPLNRVKEIHLAGYEDHGDYLLDAHNHPVSAAVWGLYKQIIRLIPDTPTLIEWDNDIPDLQILLDEAAKADTIARRYQNRACDVA